jgi:uncharacterized protein
VGSRIRIVVVLLTVAAAVAGIIIVAQGLEEQGAQERATLHATALSAFENKEYLLAMPGLLAMAEAGSANGQRKLAYIHERGLAVERDTGTAIRWYRAAAAQGDREAKLALARLLEEEGERQDQALASTLYRELALSGSTEAAIRLASLHFDGIGIAQDYVAAAYWLARAATAGNPEAQLRLGLMYRDGLGVPQDIVFAHMWLNLAAARFTAAEGLRRAEAVSARDALVPLMKAEELRESLEVAREWHSANS